MRFRSCRLKETLGKNLRKIRQRYTTFGIFSCTQRKLWTLIVKRDIIRERISQGFSYFLGLCQTLFWDKRVSPRLKKINTHIVHTYAPCTHHIDENTTSLLNIYIEPLLRSSARDSGRNREEYSEGTKLWEHLQMYNQQYLFFFWENKRKVFTSC